MVTPGENIANTSRYVNSAWLSVLLPSHVIVSPNANGTVDYSASDSASELLNKGPFFRPGTSETRVPAVHDSRRITLMFAGGPNLAIDSLADATPDVLKVYVAEDNSVQPITNVGDFRNVNNFRMPGQTNIKVVTQNAAQLDNRLALPNSRFHYVPDYRSSGFDSDKAGALLNLRHNVNSGLTSTGATFGAKYISSRVEFRN